MCYYYESTLDLRRGEYVSTGDDGESADGPGAPSDLPDPVDCGDDGDRKP